MHSLLIKLKALTRLARLHSDLQDEVEFHLAETRDELIRCGMSAREAEVAVKRRFGNSTRIRERCREAWIFELADDLRRDATYTLRLFAKQPALVATVIAILAFGIAVNAAIFSVVDCVLLRPLPYSSPDSLFLVSEHFSVGGARSPEEPVNGGNFLLWTQQGKSLSGVALLDSESADLYTRDGAVRMNGMRATASLFPVLGVEPYLGRFFPMAQDRLGNGLSIVLTYGLWKREFGGDPGIIGRTIRIDGYDTTVTGVLPESFYFPRQTELYRGSTGATAQRVDFFGNFNMLPYEQKPGIEMFNFIAIARVHSGVSSRAATAELDAVEKQVPNGADTHLGVTLTPLKDFVVGPTTKLLELSLAGAVTLMVLICANIAGLLLSKNLGRTREVAIRVAIGAARSDLVRQFLLEGLLLAIVGGVVGTAAAVTAVKALVAAAPATLPRVSTISANPRFLLVSLAISLATGLLVSLIPALRVVWTGPAAILKLTGLATSPAGSRLRSQQLLTAAEIALCSVLLIGALLIAESFAKVLSANQPLRNDGVLTSEISPPPNPYNDLVLRRNLYTHLIDEAVALPGVKAAGISSALPATGENWVMSTNFREYPPKGEERISINVRFVSPGYIPALGVPLLHGRQLRTADSGREVALISRALADQLPPGVDPIGAHVMWQSTVDGKVVPLEVLGVVDDLRTTPNKAAPPILYVPYWFWPPWGASLVLRTSGEPAVSAEAVRTLLRRIDPRLALPEMRKLTQVLDEAVAPQRYISELSGVFAFSATVLSLLGVYSLSALGAAQRTREVGIRLALGARGLQILRLLLSHAMVSATLGVGVGLAVAALATRVVAPLLYETKTTNPTVYAAVAFGLIAVSVLAGLIPVRRALRADPVAALKHE